MIGVPTGLNVEQVPTAALCLPLLPAPPLAPGCPSLSPHSHGGPQGYQKGRRDARLCLQFPWCSCSHDTMWAHGGLVRVRSGWRASELSTATSRPQARFTSSCGVRLQPGLAPTASVAIPIALHRSYPQRFQ